VATIIISNLHSFIMDAKKAPPQAMAEEDGKLPAAKMPMPNKNDDAPSSKRRKITGASGSGAAGSAAAAASSDEGEIVDIAAQLNFQPGEHIEVKWTINDDDSDDDENDEKKEDDKNTTSKAHDDKKKDTNDNDTESTKGITVWWSATLSSKTQNIHTLTDEEMEEREGGVVDTRMQKLTSVKVPIYQLNYAPLEEHGFDCHSMEEVAFISNHVLLNLSTDEMMTFRKVGEPSPPSSPVHPSMEDSTVDDDHSSIAKEFATQDEIGQFMNKLMQQCLKNTGMDERMKSMSASERLVVAERIAKAKEGFLDKMMKETEKMDGEKVITAEVVQRCMASMKGAY